MESLRALIWRLALAVWVGAIAGQHCVDAPAAPLALAAALALLGTQRPSARDRAVGVVLSALLCGASLGAGAGPERSPPAASYRVVQGRLLAKQETDRGWQVTLRGQRGQVVAIDVPRVGEPRWDLWDDAAIVGAMVAIDLRPAAAGDRRRRALHAAAVHVTEPASRFAQLASNLQTLRNELREQAIQRLPNSSSATHGLLRAMLLGDDRELSEENWRVLRVAGLAHLAVASGAQVGLMALGLSLVIAPLWGQHHPWRRQVALGGLVGAVLLLPTDPPVQRACLSLGVVLLAPWTRRALPASSALALTIMLAIAVWPEIAGARSFALTVIATAALVLPGQGARRGWRTAWRAALWPSLATWSLLAVSSGQLSLWSPVANLLAAPLSLIALLSGWVALLLPVGSWGATAGFAVAGTSVDLLFALAQEIARWPGSGMLAASVGWVWCAAHLSCSVVVVLATSARTRRHASWLWLLLAAYPLRPLPAAREGVSLLDVGQGQAVLIVVDSQRVLIDTGDALRGTALATRFAEFTARGVRQLDWLILSHGDRDHLGGAAELLYALRPRALGISAALVDSPRIRPLVAEATTLGIPTIVLTSGGTVGIAPLQLLWPPAGVRGDDNASSLVLRVRAARHSILVMGDAEQAAEAALLRSSTPVHSDILVVGHHGSRHATTDAFVARVAPRLALISCGRNNRFDHPAARVVATLRHAGAQLRTTARSGTIDLLFDTWVESDRVGAETKHQEEQRH